MNTALVPLLDDAGTVDRLAAISRDITCQREAEVLQHSLEAQIAESQKNEALARLASHIAHDVNNLLTVVVTDAQSAPGLPSKASEMSTVWCLGTVVLPGSLQPRSPRAQSRGREVTELAGVVPRLRAA